MFTGGCQCGALRYRVEAEPGMIFCPIGGAFASSPPDHGIPAAALDVRCEARVRRQGKMPAIADRPACGTGISCQVGPSSVTINWATIDGGVDLANAKYIYSAGVAPVQEPV